MSDDGRGTTLNFALCVVGVWATWSVHDFMQERIFRFQGFHFGAFMAFCLQFVSFVLSLCHRVFEGLANRESESERLEAEEKRKAALEEEQGRGLLNTPSANAADEEAEAAPAAPAPAPPAASWSVLLLYLALSLLIAAANGLSTAALNYVSMQTKVLFKSSKIVTVMLLGTLLFGRLYALAEYVYMLLVVLGLVAFLVAGNAMGGAATAPSASLVGVALLSLAVLADSLVPNVQQKLLQGAGRPKQEMIFHTNWCSALMTAVYAAATGELGSALAFLVRRPRVFWLLLGQSVAGYFGIVLYLETVRRYGSKVTVVVTSCRKLFTIGISSLAFGHPLSGFHLAGIAAVFLGVLCNANREQRCSQAVALPALAGLAVVVALELNLVQSLPSELGSWLGPLRAALAVRLL